MKRKIVLKNSDRYIRCLIVILITLISILGGCNFYQFEISHEIGIDLSENEDIIFSEEDEENTNIYKFEYHKLSEFCGEPYVELNNNQPLFTDSELVTYPFEIYSELDEYGRCGVAFANICSDIMPVGKSEPIGRIKPTGWHTIKYNDLIEGNYLYNRCHLIGYQLAGESANVRNLITGTRYLNTRGMLAFENMVSGYVESTGNHVLYRVTPVFIDDDLVASGVIIEAKSVEDDGAGICFHVYLYNVQPGIIIDYSTGSSTRSIEGDSLAAIEIPDRNLMNTEDGNDPSEVDESEMWIYVLNINTKKFHYSNCASVRDMAEKNKLGSNESREQIIARGFSPCKRCNP